MELNLQKMEAVEGQESCPQTMTDKASKVATSGNTIQPRHIRKRAIQGAGPSSSLTDSCLEREKEQMGKINIIIRVGIIMLTCKE